MCSDEGCNHTWEVEHSITLPALTQCEFCKKETAKRLISGGSFILSGGGWASDNYSGNSNHK